MDDPWWPDGFNIRKYRRSAGGHIDAALTALAELQHGHVAAAQMLTLGWSRDQLCERLRSRHLTRQHLGVYLVGRGTPTPVGRRMAAVLAAGGHGVVLADLTAAAQLGAAVREPAKVHLILPPERRMERRGITPHRSVVLPHERTIVDGVPCPTWPRLMLDIAAHRPARLEHLWHDAIYRRHMDDRALARVLVEHDRKPGTIALRRLWEARLEAIGRSANKFESDLRDILVEAGLPEPRRNWKVTVDGVELRPDAYLPERGLAIEGDGRDGHADPEQQVSDARRDALYRKLGLLPIRIGWWAVNYQRAGVVADFVRFAAAWQRTGGRWTAANPPPVFAYARRS